MREEEITQNPACIVFFYFFQFHYDSILPLQAKGNYLSRDFPIQINEIFNRNCFCALSSQSPIKQKAVN